MPHEPRKPDPVALLRGAAVEIARMPGVAERLRGLHVAGPDGRCRGCASAVRTAPVWPCRIGSVAAAAEELPSETGAEVVGRDRLRRLPPVRRG